MKKLYTAIMIISLALFFSCDEKKAKDEIKKALDKTVEETDKATPKPKGSGTLTNTKGEEAGDEGVEEPGKTPPPVLIKPVLSDKRAPWSEPILFPKVPGYTYGLKGKKTGVAITEYSSETMQVTATQSAQNVIIIATLDGKTTESNPIEFTRIQGNTLSFTEVKKITHNPSNAAVYLVASNSGTVAGDDRAIRYSISPTGEGVTIDNSSGEVTATSSATKREYTITAELPETEKYRRATASYTFVVR